MSAPRPHGPIHSLDRSWRTVTKARVRARAISLPGAAQESTRAISGYRGGRGRRPLCGLLMGAYIDAASRLLLPIRLS